MIALSAALTALGVLALAGWLKYLAFRSLSDPQMKRIDELESEVAKIKTALTFKGVR